MNRLHLVVAEGPCLGDNFDLMVVAPDVESAIEAWKLYFADELEDDEEYTINRVFVVDADLTTPGPIAWHTDRCRQVWSKPDVD